MKQLKADLVTFLENKSLRLCASYIKEAKLLAERDLLTDKYTLYVISKVHAPAIISMMDKNIGEIRLFLKINDLALKHLTEE